MVENEFVLNLSDGDDIVEKIKEFAYNNNVSKAVFVEGKGGIRDFELSETRQGGKIENFFTRSPYNVLAASGDIEKKGKEFKVRLKLSLTKTGPEKLGGVLLSGITDSGFELKLRIIDEKKIIVG